MYSPKVKELVSNLPNRGKLANASHQASGSNPICGDELELFLRVNDGFVEDCRFQARGCPAALAAAAAITLLCKGKTAAACRRIDSQQLLDYLGGLPRHKLHGVELALEVLRRALGNT